MGLVQTPPEEFNWDRGRHVLGQGSSPAATQPRSSVIGFRRSHVLINNRATVVRRFPFPQDSDCLLDFFSTPANK